MFSYISCVRSLGQSYEYLLKLVAQRTHKSGEQLPNVKQIPSELAFSHSVDIDEVVHVGGFDGAGGCEYQLQRVRSAVCKVLFCIVCKPVLDARGFEDGRLVRFVRVVSNARRMWRCQTPEFPWAKSRPVCLYESKFGDINIKLLVQDVQELLFD